MDRRTLEGIVLATWNGDSVMLRVRDIPVNVRLVSSRVLPPVGSRIKVSGYPETDLFRINLTDAEWRSVPGAREPDEKPNAVSMRQITRGNGSNREIASRYHGELIRLSGIVSTFSSADREAGRFTLVSDDEPVTVDFSTCPDAAGDIHPGSRISVAGRCLLSVRTGEGRAAFPRITGVGVLMRSPGDLQVLSSPPWWTSERLVALVSILLLLLLCILIWNRVLNRLVAKRSRQLFRADIERTSEALRVEERTRLAVELHDSLSQNLTGVALQIKTGRYDLAAMSLKSCREELRNCLWDLRSNAIDCDSMDEAIRRTLEPHIEGIDMAIRFNVPRAALSDNTSYAILRIIRELVVNAIRHGGATHVRVAGSLETRQLLFSVQDDGCGFDPDSRPGIDEGHFGLQGIYERTAALGGEVAIESHRGGGAKIVVRLPVSRTADSTTERQ